MVSKPIGRAAADAPRQAQEAVVELSPQVIAARLADPRVVAAIERIARRMVEHFDGNRILNLVVNDRGRLMIGYLSMYLHATRRPGERTSGLTPSKIKAFCAEQRLCSPGRASAMIAVMRLAGYIEEQPAPEDRRFRILVPTERLYNSFRQRWRIQFEEVCGLWPEAEQALAAVDDMRFNAGFARAAGDHFESGFRVLFNSDDLAPITELNAGLILMTSLLEGERPGPSISALSRRFGVSRAHVHQILRAAAAAGLVDPDGGPGPVLTEHGRTAMLEFFATALSFQMRFARAALAGMDDERAAA